MFPEIEVVSLSYNSRKFLHGYFLAFSKVNYPLDKITLNIVDNASSDGSADEIATSYFDSLPRVKLSRMKSNLGFTGGNNFVLDHLLRKSAAPFYLLLNIDTEIHPDMLNELLRFAAEDPAAGLIEARQEPREHPKWYDPVTFETGWCSGGGVLIRAEALRQVGIFEPRFFLYCEDVDLSWRMWLHGWKCKINPEARYSHFTESLDEERDRSIQQYYSLRNAVLMHCKYDSLRGIRAFRRMFKDTIGLQPEEKTRKLFRSAYRDALKLIPRTLVDRARLALKPKTPWIVFDGFCFERRRVFEDLPDGRRVIHG